MSETGTRLFWLHDPRLAALAASALPAWVWSIDATRVLWANPTGAAIFGAQTPAALAARKFDAGQPAAAQILRLAASLTPGAAPRLERLRGFGAGVGRALTCQCSQIALADETPAICVAATERAGPDLPLGERLRRLLAGAGEPVAAFGGDGAVMQTPANAGPRLGAATSIAAIGAQSLAAEALANGRASGDTTIGPLTLHRIGSDSVPVLLATVGESAPAAPDLAPSEIVPLAPAPEHDPGEAAIASAEPHAEPLANVAADPEPLQETVAIVDAAEAHDESHEAHQQQPRPQPHEQPTVVIDEAPEHPTKAQPSQQAELDNRVAPSTCLAPAAPLVPEAPPPAERRHPLRFVWQIDAEDRFTIGSDEFVDLIGPQTAALLARPWHEIAAALGLDPDCQIERAIATHDTWSGLSASWPVDSMAERLTVELSGLPVFDRERVFRGYRGFGVCRDLARLSELARVRHAEAIAAAEATAAAAAAAAAAPPATSPMPDTRDDAAVSATNAAPAHSAPPADTNASSAGMDAAPTETDAAAHADDEARPTEPPPALENVVPFRATPPEPPSLSPVERRAFRELSRRLTERLTATDVDYEARGAATPDAESASDVFAPDPTLADLAEAAKAASAPAAADPELDAGLFEEEPEPVTDARSVFDRFPVGVLVYRLNELVYANRAFLEWAGHESLASLDDAGGLDSLLVAPGDVAVEEGGRKPFTMASPREENPPAEARLFLVPWQGDSAFALVTTVVTPEMRPPPAAPAAAGEVAELNAILEIASDGIVVFDREGRVAFSNRKAQALFGYEAEALGLLVFIDLFAQDSLDLALDYLDGLQNNGVASVLNDGREVIGRNRAGGAIPLFMSMGRVGETGKVCAVFRDISVWKKAEEELIEARRSAERQSTAKSDFLAKISHEIRTPLNAIIGFSEVMMEERFGPVGNDRYRQYLKDIHTSGGHLISLINDLLDLSKIEAGKLDLAFTGVALNDLTQQCVAIMQPQANRERIIIRTSLAPKLPQVVADARSVRQIVLNLLSNSTKFTGAGGQVIVSTALTDAGEVVLRVRDTGVGMSEQDLATALEPFRQLATSTRFGSGGTGLGLPLTKALAEANRATFHIKSSPGAGTLVEITFPANRVLAE